MIFDENMNVINDPDLQKGYLREEEMNVYHSYVITKAEQGHFETVKEYPETGGKDVVWVVDEEQQGYWETRDQETDAIVEHYDGVIDESWPKEQKIKDVWTFSVYVEYTREELEKIAGPLQSSTAWSWRP